MEYIVQSLIVMFYTIFPVSIHTVSIFHLSLCLRKQTLSKMFLCVGFVKSSPRSVQKQNLCAGRHSVRSANTNATCIAAAFVVVVVNVYICFRICCAYNNITDYPSSKLFLLINLVDINVCVIQWSSYAEITSGQCCFRKCRNFRKKICFTIKTV